MTAAWNCATDDASKSARSNRPTILSAGFIGSSDYHTHHHGSIFHSTPDTIVMSGALATALRCARISAWYGVIAAAAAIPVAWLLKPPFEPSGHVRVIQIGSHLLAVGLALGASIAGSAALLGLRSIRAAALASPVSCLMCLYPSESEACSECGAHTTLQERAETWARLAAWWSRTSTREWRIWVVVVSFGTMLALAILTYAMFRSTGAVRSDRLIRIAALVSLVPPVLGAQACLGVLINLRRTPIRM